MFARDRDLLVYEPSLLERVGFAAQRLLGPVGAGMAGGSTVLDVSAGDAFSAGVSAGGVASLEGLGAVEVVFAESGSPLVVSRLRSSLSGGAVSPTVDAWTGAATFWTFGPQIALVHRSLLSALGVREGGAPADADAGVVYASQLVETDDWVRAEAVGALHLVFSAVAVTRTGSDPSWVAAERYGRAFEAARGRLVARIDVDGDGEAEASRSMTTTQLRRS